MSTKIEWADETFNPWWGCSRVSPACVHCYADTWARRTGRPDLWRRHGERRLFGDKHWRVPLEWNRKAERTGQTIRVFCASMADVFEDHPALPTERERLWRLIEETPALTWMLLTKRPENIGAMVPWGDTSPANVWLGTSVESQKWADVRIPKLLETPAAVRFLSCEPLLESVDLRLDRACTSPRCLHGSPPLDWVIVGGESGPGARPMDVQWARSLVEQCQAAGVSVFVKQLGAYPGFRLEDEECRGNPAPSFHHYDEARGLYIKAMQDRKGGDPSEWPEDLRVRQIPEPLGVAK